MLRGILSRAASGFDRAVSATLLTRSKRARQRSKAESLGHDERMRALAAIRAIYDRPGHYRDPDSFFAPPPPAEVRFVSVRRLPIKAGPDRGAGEVVDATWASPLAPHDEGVSGRYLAHAENQTGAARLFLGPGAGRPAAILIHGYRGGQPAIEERVWPIAWMLERGLDVALAVLPFHGVRAKLGSALFPSSDPRFTNEGFRHAIHDLRVITRLLRDRGAPAVGVMGMSLGGYTASLLATVVDDLAFAVPIIPLASIADIARDGGRLVGSEEEQRLQHEALDDVHRVVSPFARPPRLSPDRVLVIAGDGDRITPIAHARRLTEHFRAPLETFAGGHILQFGRADAFRAAGRMLGRLELLR
jgi:pimeloyl-ACP methyl ester carboxylesterase